MPRGALTRRESHELEPASDPPQTDEHRRKRSIPPPDDGGMLVFYLFIPSETSTEGMAR